MYHSISVIDSLATVHRQPQSPELAFRDSDQFNNQETCWIPTIRILSVNRSQQVDKVVDARNGSFSSNRPNQSNHPQIRRFQHLSFNSSLFKSAQLPTKLWISALKLNSWSAHFSDPFNDHGYYFISEIQAWVTQISSSKNLIESHPSFNSFYLFASTHTFTLQNLSQCSDERLESEVRLDTAKIISSSLWATSNSMICSAPETLV
jgi:hypothetical protein